MYAVFENTEGKLHQAGQKPSRYAQPKGTEIGMEDTENWSRGGRDDDQGQ